MYWELVSFYSPALRSLTYLYAVIPVGEVLHGLELLVDDADASLMCPVDNALDVFGRLAHRLQLLVQALGRLNGGLRVEFGCVESVNASLTDNMSHLPGYETLKRTFSIT
jgi:hypothetical protein